MAIFSDINEAMIMGNVTQDPELKFTPNGTKLVNLSVATNRSYKVDEEWKTEVSFHNVLLWSKLAEHASDRVVKGTRLIIRGRLETQSWEKDGQKHYKTIIVANEMILIDRYKKKDKQATEDTSFEDDLDEARRENSGEDAPKAKDDELPF